MIIFFSIANVCDANIKLNELPANTITTNTVLASNKVGFILTNETKIEDCIQTCCNQLNCNIAFFKQSKYCYLISCLTEESCIPIENAHKLATEPIDYMIRIRSLGIILSL